MPLTMPMPTHMSVLPTTPSTIVPIVVAVGIIAILLARIRWSHFAAVVSAIDIDIDIDIATNSKGCSESTAVGVIVRSRT